MSSEDIGREQEYVSMLYGRLDDLRDQAAARLAGVLREGGGTRQAMVERDASTDLYTEQLAQFSAGENGLCFGRLDFHAGPPRYIGRLGIFDEDGDYEPLLMDWRAPAARAFYLATAASPDGVRRRRHIRTRGRSVNGLDDEVLDLASADQGRHEGLTGEAALLAAMNATRTGRMSDIVETIQAEQDRIIRARHDGVLVVQGGPGTGKTAVALHRAAYLLYTYREQLSRRGVLIVGPNATFLRYIGQVLPSLGETGVLLSSVGELYPGVSARRAEPPAAAEVKGRIAMADVVAAAVHDRQEVPDDVLEIVTADGEVLRLDRQTAAAARERARRSLRPHNEARPIFVRAVVDALARQVADRVGADVLGGDNLLDDSDVDDIRAELNADPQVQASIGTLWPVLTPRQLLADLYAGARRLATAAPSLSDAERDLLLRGPAGGWTPADVPLLDEAAELLGVDDRAAKALAELRRRERVEYAQGVLDVLSGSAAHELDNEADQEVLTAFDLIDARRLAERPEGAARLTTAERAAADRKWAFGHIIVDEAQELSPMAWRMLMRRCPSRSMTLVGDVAQTGELSGAASWERMLAPYVADRWRLERLTVNYRTPAEIMTVAADVLAALDATLELPRSVRAAGAEPWRLAVEPGDLADRLARATAAEAGDGRLAVIVPTSRLDELGRAVVAAVPDAAVGEDPELRSPVVVLSVKQAKGLEFDTVLLADPNAILAESPRGLNDLYVALTRATQRLGVVHAGEPPAVLGRLRPRDDVMAVR